MAIEPKKVSELELVETLTGEELIPIVQGGQNKSAKVKTINSSFVQELTLAELQAIQSNNLPIGQQYYVTDKQWLLYVDSPTVLKPVNGSLHIFNGEALPEGIEPDVLFIDTGIVDWDISSETGTPLPISIITGYTLIVIEFYATCLGNSMVTSIGSSNIATIDELSGNIKVFASVMNIDNEMYIAATGVANEDENTLRAILEFHRSELSTPIPVPHIVSAEINESGNYIMVTFDCDLKENYNPIVSVLNGQTEIFDGALFASPKKLEIDCALSINYGDIVTLTISGIYNTWGGLLEAVVDYPVINNVPA